MFEFLSYRVARVMSTPVVTLHPDQSLLDLQRVLEDGGFNGCPVATEGDRLLGFATSFDLLKAFRFSTQTIAPHYDEIMSAPVESVMTRDPRTVSPELPLSRVLETMAELRVTGLPVADSSGIVVGMITRRDIMRALRESSGRSEHQQ